MREWVVAAGVIEGPGGVLLVQNKRTDGHLDWSPPGGVIEVGDGETVVDGLTREVFEETGLTVLGWHGPLYRVHARAEHMGWDLTVEVHQAVSFEGDVRLDDPDGVVVDAAWVDPERCPALLEQAYQFVREPFSQWLTDRWTEPRSFRYRVDGASRAELSVIRL
ncbi:MAG TPA: NUDIX hydrolase [Acidimicrobiales bacterium]|nr:NUDIX hydrolase [Acidimicrobiales bacterium]